MKPRHQAPGTRHQSAFTLIEILVAIAILAVALAATTRAASIATDGAIESRQRLLATWTAENRVAELRARRLFPSTGTTQFRATQANIEMVVDETVSDTPNPAIRRVDLAVADARAPQRVLTKLTAYVSP